MTEHTEITEQTESSAQQGLKLSVSSVISACCGHLSSGLFSRLIYSGLLMRATCARKRYRER